PGSFGVNTWYLVELNDIDYTNRTFDFYMDGGLIVDDYPFRGFALTGVDNIQLKNFDGGAGVVGNWDDIQFNIMQGATINIDDEISCAGDADGGLSAGTENLVGPFTYQWNTGETTASIANLSSGDFSVTVTDVGGASFVASTTLSDPDPIVATTTIDADLTCSGVDDGQITGSATGGTGIYDYLWNTGATDPTIMNLGAGTFVVTVSDANGCFDVASATLTEIDPIIASATITEDLSCFGDNNGVLTASGLNGMGPYDYLWNTGETTETISNLSSGDFFVTITDATGCFGVASSTLSDPDLLVASTTILTDNLCGLDNGILIASATSGEPPFAFLWNNGETTESISNLDAGDYFVTISNDNGCFDIASATILDIDPLEASAVVVQDASCGNIPDGSIQLSVIGGSAPYTYNWSNAVTSADNLNLFAGDYDYTVTDANGCILTGTETVDSEDVAPPSLVLQDITAELDINGMASVNASALDAGSTDPCGIASFQFESNFAPPGQASFNSFNPNLVTTLDFTCADIGANLVTVVVTDVDGNNISATATITVEDNIAPVFTVCDAGPFVYEVNNGCVFTGTIPNPLTAAVFQISDNCDPVLFDIEYLDEQGDPFDAPDNDDPILVDVGYGFIFDAIPVGVNTINMIATDAGGNTAMCSTTVIITDPTAPTAVCQDITVTLDNNGMANITAADVDGGSTDNCGIASLVVSPSSFDCSNLGANAVTLTVTDNSGNTTSCTATVTVEGELPVA
ncbi:MAG: hypothetical protein AAFV80_20280, partial [Bacteroidota bacterium]